MQSASPVHSAHVPGAPTQAFSVPVPEHAAPDPHRQVRFEHVFASVGLHGTPHPVHWLSVAATQAATPLVSQQSWLLVQGFESVGSQAPHSPFWVPLRTHAALPLGLAKQRASASPVIAASSHATQALATQSGFFALPVQSLSDVHPTQ